MEDRIATFDIMTDVLAVTFSHAHLTEALKKMQAVEMEVLLLPGPIKNIIL